MSGRTGWGKPGPIGRVCVSLSPVLSPSHVLLLIFVASMHGASVITQIGQGTDLSLHWPFYGLWVNIVVAIIAGELRRVARMTTSNRWMRVPLAPAACSVALGHLLLAPQTPPQALQPGSVHS